VSNGRVTLITGASQGIGRELALAFASNGDSLVLAARNEENLAATADAIGPLGVDVFVVPTDVTAEDQVDAMAQSALDRFGHVDNVVNNSGIGGPSGPLWQLGLEDWKETFAVNVEGVFLVCKALLPQMIERRNGTIINIGSITGKRPLWGRSPYAASKAAIIGLTRTLALEAGNFGVRVNLISPGFVEGPRLDWVIKSQADRGHSSEEEVRREFESEAALNRLTDPNDVAMVALFLASDAAQAVSGADINVNSGAVMY
jgi:NAD(P)-dependent dehydrogenase (short-subunit alcohol dehydrogenase family)